MKTDFTCATTNYSNANNNNNKQRLSGWLPLAKGDRLAFNSTCCTALHHAAVLQYWSGFNDMYQSCLYWNRSVLQFFMVNFLHLIIAGGYCDSLILAHSFSWFADLLSLILLYIDRGEIFCVFQRTFWTVGALCSLYRFWKVLMRFFAKVFELGTAGWVVVEVYWWLLFSYWKQKVVQWITEQPPRKMNKKHPQMKIPLVKLA